MKKKKNIRNLFGNDGFETLLGSHFVCVGEQIQDSNCL